MKHTARRISYVFLCSLPFLDFVFVGFRGFRIPYVYQTVGAFLFAAAVASAWLLGARQIRVGEASGQRLALAGAFLIAPYVLVSLLWVGLGTPWDATAAENVMRYQVLLVASIAIAVGFVVLHEGLRDAGEHLYATPGLTLNLLAASTYVLWLSVQIGAWVADVRDGHFPAALGSLSGVFDVLLDVGCALTYLATAAFAVSLGRTHWLGNAAARTYVAANLVALLFLVLRGISYPDPTALSSPWYTQPSFIAGIPAVPWIMPFLFGVVLLRRAGNAEVPA